MLPRIVALIIYLIAVGAILRWFWAAALNDRPQDPPIDDGEAFRAAMARHDTEYSDWPVITEEELVSLHAGGIVDARP